MDIDALLKLLELDSPQELEYFEQYAEILECESEIPQETLAQFFAEANKAVIAELNDAYFEDILKYVPADSAEFYTMLDVIGKSLSALATTIDTDEVTADFAEEFYKFRNWYVFESEVHCINLDDEQEQDLPVFDALTLYRTENLNNVEYSYDFETALDYPIDEYIVTLDALAGSDDDDDYSDNDERWTEDN